MREIAKHYSYIRASGEHLQIPAEDNTSIIQVYPILRYNRDEVYGKDLYSSLITVNTFLSESGLTFRKVPHQLYVYTCHCVLVVSFKNRSLIKNKE